MPDTKTVVYRGPGPFHAIRHPAFGYWEFPANEPKEVPPEVFDYVMSLNPWNATMENASDYGAKLYEAVTAGGGDEQ